MKVLRFVLVWSCAAAAVCGCACGGSDNKSDGTQAEQQAAKPDLTGVILLGEKMTVRETVGCVLMFIAVVLAQLSPVISSIRRNGRSHR